MPARRPYAFDPVRVGRAECAAWVAYYRRDWTGVLRGAWRLVRHGFDLGAVGNLRGAWFVLRANQVWAPVPDNDPAAARRFMERFYRLADRAGRVAVDPPRAAVLEVDWWRAHRARQRAGAGVTDLVESLVALYAYVYEASPETVRRAAELRVEAMDLSDDWVAAGCRLDDPLLLRERALLIESYCQLPSPDGSGN